MVDVDMSYKPTRNNDVIGIVSKLLKGCEKPHRRGSTVRVSGVNTTVNDKEGSVNELVNVSHSSGPTGSSDTRYGKRRLADLLVNVITLKSGKRIYCAVVHNYSRFLVRVKIHRRNYLRVSREGEILVIADSIRGIILKACRIKRGNVLVVFLGVGLLCYVHYRVLSEIYRELVKSSSVVLGNLNIGFKLLLGISYRFGKAYEEIPRGVDDHVALFASVYEFNDLFHNSFCALIGGISYNVFTVYKLSRSLTRFKSSVKSCRLLKLSLSYKYSGRACYVIVKIGGRLCHDADLVFYSRAQIAVSKPIGLVGKLFPRYIRSVSAVAEYDELFGIELTYLSSLTIRCGISGKVLTAIRCVGVILRVAGCEHGDSDNKRQKQRN